MKGSALRVFAIALPLLLGACATPPEPRLQVRKVAIVEPLPSEVYVRLGSGAAPMPNIPAPVDRRLPLDMALVEGTLIAGLDSLQAKSAANVTVRMREGCPDIPARSAAMRERTLAQLREALSDRFVAVVLPREEYRKLRAGPADAGADAYVHFNLDASLWAGTPFMDYWPVLRAVVVIETGDGLKVSRPEEVRAANRPGVSFPSADDVVARCAQGLAALDALIPSFVARIKTQLAGHLQEKP
jgi:hypothetical protein